MIFPDVENGEVSNVTILTVFKFPMWKTGVHIKPKVILGAALMHDKAISIQKLRIFFILASKNKTLWGVYLLKHFTNWKGWNKERVCYRKYSHEMYVGNEKYFQGYFFQ